MGSTFAPVLTVLFSILCILISFFYWVAVLFANFYLEWRSIGQAFILDKQQVSLETGDIGLPVLFLLSGVEKETGERHYSSQCFGSMSRIRVIDLFIWAISSFEISPIFSANLLWLTALIWKQSTTDFFLRPLIVLGSKETKNGFFSQYELHAVTGTTMASLRCLS